VTCGVHDATPTLVTLLYGVVERHMLVLVFCFVFDSNKNCQLSTGSTQSYAIEECKRKRHLQCIV
jgi:hypothetical protein